ncbi:threonine--tRNA ligase [Candidatus Absconditicoccus praedator]|uniref:threonine--tRNA ligase n=1 Tax=Candidatus Absconditicoccus praedator TaxID=2735562 RepID=UPI001E5D2D79|nr:threonine--tRNA ligase [Candidatus Absconditicoccus praedator]UFX82615.1 threonine--tRNA ligase [Candidatus Absconditicoccus praedator]
MTESLLRSRHSLAHILAQAAQREFGANLKLGVGPAIDDGCYYDILPTSEEIKIQDKDLKNIQKYMEQVIKQKQEFHCISMDVQTAKDLNNFLGQELKNELIDEFVSQGESEITYYINLIPAKAKDALMKGANPSYISYYEEINKHMHQNFSLPEDKFVCFIDMCEGPHIAHTGELDPKTFKLAKIAGAYRRGDEKNPMMTRVYAYAFASKEELQEHINFLEEAKKRDHRVLGKQLKLFTTSDLVGAGLPLLQPRGMIIRKVIEDYLWELHKEKGYERVWSPHIAKKDLYETSGHWDKFGNELMKIEGKYEDFCVKPMNCPHHMQIFADNQFSYRDLPVRYFEPATIYRDEKPGQLGGLTRVRSITQDDGHLFCRIDQLGQEISTIVDIIKTFYEKMGMMNDYWVSLSIRGEEKSDYIGEENVWQEAESALEKAANDKGLNFKKVEGEAAFYGPKLDFMFKDCLNREWQLATIQLDFNLPERFELEYTNDKGEKERPVVIHRAICGSLERFMGIMIEHFAGAFPFWLAPEQIKIIPVADKFEDYAHNINQQFKNQGIRSNVDSSDDSFNKKIRNGEKAKIPYLIIVGEKESSNNTLSIRRYSDKKQYESTLNEFLNEISK